MPKRIASRQGPGRWTRREFVSTLSRTAGVSAFLATPPFLRAASAQDRPPRRVSIIATEIRKYSHAQHFVDRFLEGYGWQGQYHHPPFELASLYVDQIPDRDLSRERSRRHGVKIYPTIAEALTLGGSSLAVDGVLLIAEHGSYPRNEKGQKLYPRYKFFKEIVKVFEASARSVPVFNDKHLSTDWHEATEMMEDSKRLGFPFLAGSSLPVTWRIPSLDIPLNTPLSESVCVCYGGVDSYDFHGFETAQCMSERRAGGEVGIGSVHAVRGEALWNMLEKREQTRKLFIAALSRSHTCKGPPGYTFAAPSFDWLRERKTDATGWFIEHLDGFKTAMFTLNGLILDFNYAGMSKETGEITSCQMYLPMPPRQTTLADFFNPLVHHIEEMILTGKPAYPAERTLLTTGMTLAGVESLHRGETRVATPGMDVRYRVDGTSTYWRA